MMGLLCVGSASALPAQNVRSAADPVVDTLVLRAHTRFLADDALEGRGTGTRGERAAAAYIASVLLRLGLHGLGPDGDYLLPIPMRAAEIDPATRVTVRGEQTAQDFVHGRDFVVNTGGPEAFRDFSGPVVVAGPPAAAADALRGRELAGRVVAVAGPLGVHALQLVPAWRQSGVTGIVVLVPDPEQFGLYVRSRGDTRFMVAADVDDPVWQPALPVLIAGPSLSVALLRSGTRTANGAAVETNLSLEAIVAVRERQVPAANVGAILYGSDPALRDEVVVYTAHYDHLGISAPDATGDSIYNGFSDDAAGVAMLLAMAEAIAVAPPARSIAFLFFTGEERGLLGSSYFAAEPPFPLERVRALINLDAGAPPAPPVSWRIAGGTESPLGLVAQHVAQERGWTVQLGAASPNSDYWPFLRRGVPALFLIPGDVWENTAPEQRDALRRRWDRYHQAGDHYDDAFPFSGLQRYADFALTLGLRVANDGH